MITIVLIRPQNPANLGFIARLMGNFDISKLILIDPLCSPLDDEAQRTSMHAKDILKKSKVKDITFLKKFNLVVGTTSILGTDYNIPRTSLTPEEFAKKVDERSIALVFGNEGTGLTNEEIKKCDFLITIPTSKEYSALNLSHAASIILYELYKLRGQNKINSHIVKASRKENDVLMQRFYSIIDNIEFSTEEKRETQKVVWKKIIAQSMMSKREAFAAIGFLRKIEKISKS